MVSILNLNEKQKEIILVLGDLKKGKIIGQNLKNRKEIKKKYFEDITDVKYDKLLDGLYFQGLISYMPPGSIKYVDNTKHNSKEILENHFVDELKWKEQEQYIKLTEDSERTFSGRAYYNSLIYDETNKSLLELQEQITLIDRKYVGLKSLTEKIDNNLIKNIEILSIFIAVFALIVGNISVLGTIQGLTKSEAIGFIFILNGILLLVILFLMISVRKFILEKMIIKSGLDILYFIIPIVLITVGINYLFNEDPEVQIELETEIEEQLDEVDSKQILNSKSLEISFKNKL
ncbi:hypothetical protein HYG86_01430 [Alkalicella caledoniensis]|uniref:Uncharacterized protein n=1 Tax=Alkalicella caledoniensis TaxID=2731377 RepID=A0A7G9W4A9_ALKCA|nr:hypothetical protein [Alkalicella caledoniensis]QNO13521.1 hypothetical protein HYG86_01430 [Alkalicella caledoniensis]